MTKKARPAIDFYEPNEMDLLSPEEVQAMLRVGTNTIYNLLSTNEIKHFRIGRSYKIPRYCVKEYIDRKCEEHCQGAL